MLRDYLHGVNLENYEICNYLKEFGIMKIMLKILDNLNYLERLVFGAFLEIISNNSGQFKAIWMFEQLGTS